MYNLFVSKVLRFSIPVHYRPFGPLVVHIPVKKPPFGRPLIFFRWHRPAHRRETSKAPANITTGPFHVHGDDGQIQRLARKVHLAEAVIVAPAQRVLVRVAIRLRLEKSALPGDKADGLPGAGIHRTLQAKALVVALGGGLPFEQDGWTVLAGSKSGQFYRKDGGERKRHRAVRIVQPAAAVGSRNVGDTRSAGIHKIGAAAAAATSSFPSSTAITTAAASGYCGLGALAAASTAIAPIVPGRIDAATAGRFTGCPSTAAKRYIAGPNAVGPGTAASASHHEQRTSSAIGRVSTVDDGRASSDAAAAGKAVSTRSPRDDADGLPGSDREDGRHQTAGAAGNGGTGSISPFAPVAVMVMVAALAGTVQSLRAPPVLKIRGLAHCASNSPLLWNSQRSRKEVSNFFISRKR